MEEKSQEEKNHQSAIPNKTRQQSSLYLNGWEANVKLDYLQGYVIL